VDESPFAGRVGLAVFVVIAGELSLELPVGVDQGGVGAQRVPERQLLVPAAAAGGHQVKVRDAVVGVDLDEEPAVGTLIEFG
jgi:hypothetical protein